MTKFRTINFKRRICIKHKNPSTQNLYSIHLHARVHTHPYILSLRRRHNNFLCFSHLCVTQKGKKSVSRVHTSRIQSVCRCACLICVWISRIHRKATGLWITSVANHTHTHTLVFSCSCFPYRSSQLLNKLRRNFCSFERYSDEKRVSIFVRTYHSKKKERKKINLFYCRFYGYDPYFIDKIFFLRILVFFSLIFFICVAFCHGFYIIIIAVCRLHNIQIHSEFEFSEKYVQLSRSCGLYFYSREFLFSLKFKRQFSVYYFFFSIIWSFCLDWKHNTHIQMAGTRCFCFY